MRKRIVPARFLTVTAVVTLTLLVAACDRASGKADAGTDSSVGSVVTGAASVDAAVPMMAQREDAMAGRARMASAPPRSMEAAASPAGASVSAAITFGSPLPPIDASGAMLIRNGQASIEVVRVDDAVAKLRQTAIQFGGFVANTSIVGGKEEHRSAQLEIRVPSAQFDAAVAALSALGKVESVSATVQDAGDEYVDLGARVANARHMEARLVEMLARRTGKLSEALTVEQELRRVREEIERFDARLKWLERKSSISSLQVALHEPTSVLDPRGPSPIAEAFAEAWRRAVGVLAWCIASLGILVPLALLIGGAVLLTRQVLRLKRVTQANM